eukprot:8402-Heterococcus_DN1.PRE.2
MYKCSYLHKLLQTISRSIATVHCATTASTSQLRSLRIGGETQPTVCLSRAAAVVVVAVTTNSTNSVTHISYFDYREVANAATVVANRPSAHLFVAAAVVAVAATGVITIAKGLLFVAAAAAVVALRCTRQCVCAQRLSCSTILLPLVLSLAVDAAAAAVVVAVAGVV